MLTDVRNLGGAPSSRAWPIRGDDSIGFLFLLRVSGEMSADGAPPFVRGVWCPRPSARSDSFATPMAKGSRVQVVGSVREAPGGLPCVALFWYFSLDRERKVRISISPINPNLKFPILQLHKLKSPPAWAGGRVYMGVTRYSRTCCGRPREGAEAQGRIPKRGIPWRGRDRRGCRGRRIRTPCRE